MYFEVWFISRHFFKRKSLKILTNYSPNFIIWRSEGLNPILCGKNVIRIKHEQISFWQSLYLDLIFTSWPMKPLGSWYNSNLWWYWYLYFGRSEGFQLDFHIYFQYIKNLDNHKMTVWTQNTQNYHLVANWLRNCFIF